MGHRPTVGSQEGACSCEQGTPAVKEYTRVVCEHVRVEQKNPRSQADARPGEWEGQGGGGHLGSSGINPQCEWTHGGHHCERAEVGSVPICIQCW